MHTKCTMWITYVEFQGIAIEKVPSHGWPFVSLCFLMSTDFEGNLARVLLFDIHQE